MIPFNIPPYTGNECKYIYMRQLSNIESVEMGLLRKNVIVGLKNNFMHRKSCLRQVEQLPLIWHSCFVI